jgi:hypothetical protein
VYLDGTVLASLANLGRLRASREQGVDRLGHVVADGEPTMALDLDQDVERR